MIRPILSPTPEGHLLAFRARNVPTNSMSHGKRFYPADRPWSAILCVLLLGAQISAAQKVGPINSEAEALAGISIIDMAGGGKVLAGPTVPVGDARESHHYTLRALVTRNGASCELAIAFQRRGSYPNFETMEEAGGKPVPIKPFQQQEINQVKVETHMVQVSLPYLEGAMKKGIDITFKGRREKVQIKIPDFYFRGVGNRIASLIKELVPPASKNEEGRVGDEIPSLNEIFGGPAFKPGGDENPFVLLTREKFAGQSFVFMPVPHQLQALAYRLNENSAETFHLPYQKYVGKTLRILSAKIDQFGGAVYNTKVEETGETFQAYEGIPRTFPYLVLKRDLEEARRLYENKTLWLNFRQVLVYDATADVPEARQLPKLDPVLVNRVVIGSLQNPIRFIFTDKNDKQYYLDVAMSMTDSDGDGVRLFADTFLVFSPRERLQWPAAVFEAIQNERIQLGMTSDQVLLAWGRPKSRTRSSTPGSTTERWVYPTQVVLISNGVCTEVK